MKITFEFEARNEKEFMAALQEIKSTLPEAADKKPTLSKPATDKSKKAPKKKEVEPVEQKPITLEEVRAVLAKLSQAGKQAEVKSLITKYEAKKLSDIPADQYPALLQEAESL